MEEVHETAAAAKAAVRAFVNGLLKKTDAKIEVDEMIRQIDARKAGFITPFFPADDDYVLVLRALESLETYQHTFATEPFAK